MFKDQTDRKGSNITRDETSEKAGRGSNQWSITTELHRLLQVGEEPARGLGFSSC